MASTGKTPNYNLSQFAPTDKPSWLGDVNADMSAIDTGMTANKSTADGAMATGQAAQASANQAQAGVNQLLTDVSGIQTTLAKINENLTFKTAYATIPSNGSLAGFCYAVYSNQMARVDFRVDGLTTATWVPSGDGNEHLVIATFSQNIFNLPVGGINPSSNIISMSCVGDWTVNGNYVSASTGFGAFWNGAQTIVITSKAIGDTNILNLVWGNMPYFRSGAFIPLQSFKMGN